MNTLCSRWISKGFWAVACLVLIGGVAQARLESYTFEIPDFVPDLDSEGNPTEELNDASFKVIVNTRLNRAEVHGRSQINNESRRTVVFYDTFVGEVFITPYHALLIRSDIMTVSSRGSVSAVARTTPLLL